MLFQDPSALLFCVISFSDFPVVDARDMLPRSHKNYVGISYFYQRSHYLLAFHITIP